MNIDDLKDLDDETRKEIEALLKVTREKDGGEYFSEAQYNIGVALEKSKNIEEAMSVWNDIRHIDSPRKYAQAQLHIGFILHKNNNVEDALSVWCDVKHSDNPKAYSKAQFNIGLILEKNKKIEESLVIWSSIKREDSPETYAKAQANIGNTLFRNNKIGDAILVWNNIDRKDDSKIYAKVHFEIGTLLNCMYDVEGALSAWENINYEDDLETYLKAQLEIGSVLFQTGNIEQSLLALCKIKYLDDREIYSEAQFYMGGILLSYGYEEEALLVWHGIKRIDNSKVYANVQLLTGLALLEKKEFQKAFVVWNNIESTDESKIYAQAQFNIGISLIYRKQENDIIDARNAFKVASELFPYESYCYSKICDLLDNVITKSLGYNFLDLLNKTLDIVNILQLDFGQESNEDKSPERKLAHYTNTSITNILLEIDENNDLPSSFRLNTINNVNDPSEGHLLVNYLKGMRENSFYAPDFDGDLHAFISCFTFNHDSLNQFRLYGKEADKEASGVSLVFKKEFFQMDNVLGGLSFLSLDNNVRNKNRALPFSEIDEKSNLRENPDSNIRINKQPVMRCVYIDPTSSYVQLAQRNRITFFREFGDETVLIEENKISKAEHEWKNYKNYIDTKIKAFDDAFVDLKDIYKSIMEEKVKIDKNNSESSNDIDVLTDEILLPLKYLIKHSAFQEEQECRMIYVTSIKAPEVKMVDKRFLFVEYEAKVKENLNKVYIAPAATKYQLYLAWLLRDRDVKIELSNNPYRQT